MSSDRFYLPGTELAAGQTIELPEPVGIQVARVLRMQIGDSLRVFNGSGPEWAAEIISISRDVVEVSLGAAADPQTEARLRVAVGQALVAQDRMEYVVQKSTELGAARIVPVLTERVQARDRSISENRLARWRRIAVEAAEQSGRTRVPEISDAQALAAFLVDARALGPVVLLWEEEQGTDLRDAVRESLRGAPEHVTVLIGPVGGLSGDEAESARDAGAIIAGAGPRILRAETAPVVALTALMYEAGELGPRG